MAVLPNERVARLLLEVPELRQYIESQRRADYARASAGDKLLGYDKSVVCEKCGHVNHPERTR